MTVSRNRSRLPKAVEHIFPDKELFKCVKAKREQNTNPSKTLLLSNELKLDREGGEHEVQPQIYGDSESGSALFPDFKLTMGRKGEE